MEGAKCSLFKYTSLNFAFWEDGVDILLSTAKNPGCYM